MPGKKRRNPFEDHIESESFDVSHLGRTAPPTELELEIQAFLNRLPQPINHDALDSALNDRQKLISAYVSIEMVKRVFRTQFAEELEDFSDEQLAYLLTVPISVAMLAEKGLHKEDKIIAFPEKPQRPRGTHPLSNEEYSQVPVSDLGIKINKAIEKLRFFIQNLLDKRR